MSVFIIAEAGVNHNGNLETAKLMVDKAKEAGADCIKFQTFVSENLVSKRAGKADYQKLNTASEETQLEMLKKLELSFDAFVELKGYCDDKGIEFLSTAFDLDSIDHLNHLGMRMWKIPSGDITNLPYLLQIARLKKPVILSTGMCNLEEVRASMAVLQENGAGQITLLHCTTQYPTPYVDVNLNAMNTLQKEFHVPVGYSDHTKGIEVAVAAVALGATVIEKHFTLDKNMEGPDHKASLEPQELASMVQAIRNIELSLGTGIKSPAASEINNMDIARKSIIAKHNIKKGEIFTEENLTVKRPGNGISPMQWYQVIGQAAMKNYEEDELIEL
jgi:N,N'-diacetyllegionaminate synthase